MALSNTFYTNVGSYNRLQVEWSATQNHSTNTSSVTVRLYWMAVRSGVGANYGTSSNPVSITINGNSATSTATPYLRAGEKKLIYSRTVPVVHDADGEKSFGISAYFNIDTNISGTYYGRETVSKTETLNPIPRESVLSGGASWTAGDNRTTTITRYSSSFTHSVKYYAANTSGSWVLIKDVHYTTQETSKSSSFTVAEIQKMYDILAGRSTTTSRIVIETNSSGGSIGTTRTDGTMYSEHASFSETVASFNIGNSFTTDIKWYNTNFTHTVRLKNGGTTLKTYTAHPGGQLTITTSDIATTLYNLTPNSNSLSLTIETVTYMGGVQVKDSTTESIIARVTNSNPTFDGVPSYFDMNDGMVTITGNNQYIVSSKSLVRVMLPVSQGARGVNGAIIKQYVASLAGKTKTVSYSALSEAVFDLGTIEASTNQTLLIRAVDSRGNSTPITKTILVIPYTAPSLTAKATRLNGFEASTTLSLSGRVSELKINGVSKNKLGSAWVRYREYTKTTWTQPIQFIVTGFPQYIASDITVVLDSTKSYEVEFEVFDSLGSRKMVKSVTTGKPLVFFDDRLNAVGIGDFPSNPNEILIAMKMRFAGNQWASSGGGLDMGNSDITGLNGLFMNDIANNNGEGFNWLRTGRPEGSTSVLDYDNWRMLDGVIYANGKKQWSETMEVLWKGYSYVHEGVIIPYGKNLKDMPNGIILLWSRYTNGAPENSNWNTTVIPKNYEDFAGGSGMWCPLVAANTTATVPALAYKYVYPSGTGLGGYSRNNTGSESGQVLRAIMAF